MEEFARLYTKKEFVEELIDLNAGVVFDIRSLNEANNVISCTRLKISLPDYWYYRNGNTITNKHNTDGEEHNTFIIQVLNQS